MKGSVDEREVKSLHFTLWPQRLCLYALGVVKKSLYALGVVKKKGYAW